jgi:hypothetical protein
MTPHCPLCKSKYIGRSRRRGFIESMLFKLVNVRPYRCQSCDLRFFRWAAIRRRTTPLISATSTRSDFQGSMSPSLKESTADQL